MQKETAKRQAPSIAESKPNRLEALGILQPGLFLVSLLQLGLLCFLVIQLQVEQSLMLPLVLPIVLSGFLIHTVCPPNLRLPIFLTTGLVCLFYILGWGPGLLSLALFSLFFGILQLPASVRIRGILLAIAGLILGLIWAYKPTIIPGSSKLIPVIGSIFMFRASVYLYDVKHEKAPAPFLQRLAYFFMLPNIFFTLFPVVDYKVWRRSYYNRPAQEIYRKGIRWMIRGFFHLMLYRIIYYFIQPDPQMVFTLSGLAFYAFTTYALILRLSGIFHFATGILCLFGFNLPPVFHNYFLATGFSDLWRRINIYWRDYVMKVFYYPLYFRFRGMGNTSRLVVSTLAAFAITWFLHSFQWFWIRGSFPFHLTDTLFWAILGISVAANGVYQQKRANKKKGNSAQSPYLKTAIKSLQITGMLGFMSLLWTFWNSPTVSDWWELVSPIRTAAFAEWKMLALLLLLFYVLLFAGLLAFEQTRLKKWMEPDEHKPGSMIWGGLSLLVFLLLLYPPILEVFQPLTKKPVSHLYETRLSQADDALMVQGYYEDILIPNQFSSPLPELQQRPEDWVAFRDSDAARQLNYWPHQILKPNKSILFKGQPLSTNSHAMRDKEYSLEKPEGHYRIAIFGGSYVFGSGVSNEEVFEQVCEEKLNTDGEESPVYELLNFSVPGYHLLHLVYAVENNVERFNPDEVFVISQGVDFEKCYKIIKDTYEGGDTLGIPYIDRIVADFGISPGKKIRLKYDQIDSLSQLVVKKCLKRISNYCDKAGSTPVFVYWPRTKTMSGIQSNESADKSLHIAQKIGYKIINLIDVYDSHDPDELILASFDRHPNILGHKIFAERLYEVILKKDYHDPIPTE
ncbi:MAG: hypothetical protein GYB31_02140 [Bacteroidetes bacterium]|nr:hypothetical protein [Bacteroidota bacterium]